MTPFSRGRCLESRALLVVSLAGLAGIAAAVIVRSRPGDRAAEVLHPPAGRDRFVVYINDDDWVTIALLPRVGRTLAQRIVSDREVHGRFERPEDLTRVSGVGPRTIEAFRPYLCFDRPLATRPDEGVPRPASAGRAAPLPTPVPWGPEIDPAGQDRPGRTWRKMPAE